MKSVFLFFAACLLSVAGSHTPASAGWTVVNLNPDGAVFSRAFGVSSGQQVGEAGFGGQYHAGLWNGTAASWVDLDPIGSGSSGRGVSGGQQAGYATVDAHGLPGLQEHAVLWNGSAASWVDLDPFAYPSGMSDTWSSRVYGVGGGQQVGCAYVDGFPVSSPHASLWSGTAASWVDLHPSPGFGSSGAWGVSGGQQVGYFDGPPFWYLHAALWSGTAASWIDLNPAWSYGSSACGVGGGQQVGGVGLGNHREDGNNVSHASLWSGSAASFVDLDQGGPPPNYINRLSPYPYAWNSGAYGVSGGYQAGAQEFEQAPDEWVPHAGMWSGTAASWVDLHTFLPSGYSESYAYGIETSPASPGEVWVVGWAHNTSLNQQQAILWHGTNIPPPLPPLPPPPPLPVCGISNKAVYDPIMSAASAKFTFKVSGKVTVLISGYSFTVDDGSGMPVMVVAPGLSGIQDGDYAVASGTFSGAGLSLVLHAQPSNVVKLR
ncbi:MAG: hypothetical protein Q7T82_09880 [Armatimonadota bacterium]|nr:hypothetical protein [Armatimonadota bacterium]